MLAQMEFGRSGDTERRAGNSERWQEANQEKDAFFNIHQMICAQSRRVIRNSSILETSDTHPELSSKAK
jgi:hypothetical protein